MWFCIYMWKNIDILKKNKLFSLQGSWDAVVHAVLIFNIVVWTDYIENKANFLVFAVGLCWAKLPSAANANGMNGSSNLHRRIIIGLRFLTYFFWSRLWRWFTKAVVISRSAWRGTTHISIFIKWCTGNRARIPHLL